MDDHLTEQLFVQQGEDRLSNLPEGILHHIFSFLPTIDAVRTTILSSRWNRFWVSLSTLDFREDIELDNPRVRFVDFVYKVFGLRDSVNIRKLDIFSIDETIGLDINNWLTFATWRNVVDLNITIFANSSLAFPSCLFSCKSLQRLTLDLLHMELRIPNRVCFPSLDFLHLYIGANENSQYHFITSFISNCPVLQEFKISADLEKEPNFELKIFSSTLIRIVIDIYSCSSYIYNFQDCSIIISSPYLNYLNVRSTIPVCFSVLCPSVIEEVRLNIIYCDGLNNHLGESYKFFTNLVNNDLHPVRALRLIYEVSKTKDLTLYGEIMRILFSSLKGQFPAFCNLTHLDISLPNGCGLQLVLDFLRTSASLKTLVLRKKSIPCVEMMKELELRPVDVELDCPLLHLELVEMKAFQGEVLELKIIKYLLKKARVLKKLIIRSRTLVLEKDTFFKIVQSFPMASATCVIELH